MENNSIERDLAESSLKSCLSALSKICEKACEIDDPKFYRLALKLLRAIEDKLWKFYMEVYRR